MVQRDANECNRIIYYIILPGMGQSHTYANILREKEFCVNFISSKYYMACGKTIEHNDEGDDEISVGGFTAMPCKTISVPRIEESIVSFECKLVSTHDILDLILNVANSDERIRAVRMEGSRANPAVPKDKFQDYDISFYVADAGSQTWLQAP